MFISLKEFKVHYEFILFILTIFSISSVFVENNTLYMIDKIVYIIFVVDVFTRLYLADNKKQFIQSNWFDFVAIIPLDSLFKSARLIKLIKIIRLIVILKRYKSTTFELLKQHGLINALIFIGVMILSLSLLIYIIEPDIKTYPDAVWWSIATTTTVGYGDLSPSTHLGRIIAVILMFSGIGVIGMLTGTLANYFIKKEDSTDPTILFLKSEIDRLPTMSDKEIDRFCILVKTYRDDIESSFEKESLEEYKRINREIHSSSRE